MLDVVVDANGGGAGGAWAGAGTGVGAGADAVAAPVLRGFGGRLAHRVLNGVNVLLGHRALRGFGGRRHRGVSSLRALTAAMRIARKRNRSPQNGAGRDDGSSQCSLL